jgi:predicted RNA-binding Zn ribbon-like protein
MQAPTGGREGTAATTLLRDFVNTREPQIGADELTSPQALAAWLEARDLVAGSTELEDAHLEHAVAVREGLRALLMTHAGHEADAEAVDALNHVFAGLPLGLAFDAGGYALVPAGTSPLARPLARIADAIRVSSEDGTWQRLKVCARESCRWAFYDASRNKVRRWCSMSGCGNHIKMQRAYARRTAPS